MFKKQHLPVIIILLLTSGLLGYFAFFNEYAEGGPDNIWHYYFSRYATSYPEFFLHHWGKPFFILLSTSFAQFGFYGLQIFNILVGLGAAIITYKFCEKLKIKYSWFSVVLLLYTPLYFAMLQSGMTEPLMSLVLLTSLYLLYNENFLAGTVLMSFSIYTRTEGTFLTLYLMFYLLFIGKWKYIPFLGVGFLVYSLIGKYFGHDFFWFFTENPYKATSPYGHGTWFDIISKYKIIWGLPQTIVLLLSLGTILYSCLTSFSTINRKKLNTDYKILLLVVLPAILFIGFHIVAWKYGKFASLGLERVLASVSPLCVLLCCYGINKRLSDILPRKISFTLIIVFLLLVIRSTFQAYQYPLKAITDAKIENEVSKWFVKNYDQNCVIYYAHPGIVFYSDRNPFDKKLNIEQFDLKVDEITDKSLPTYIFWDSQFSEESCRLKLNDLLNSPKVKLIHPLIEDSGFKMYVFELVR